MQWTPGEKGDQELQSNNAAYSTDGHEKTADLRRSIH